MIEGRQKRGKENSGASSFKNPGFHERSVLRENMSRIFHNIKLGIDDDLEEKLSWLVPNYSSYHIMRQSVDARRRHSPHLIYSVEVFEENESPPDSTIKLEKVSFKGDPVIIIGSGPAGLFAALRLLERGIPCRIFERGSDCVKRLKAINHFWRYGELDPRNNVCYGEGGAGLYSDGKLITRIKSPHIPYVMQKLVEFGAPSEILYLANPHVGSDRIRRVIPQLRQHLLKLGCEIFFDTRITELLTENKMITGVRTEHNQIFRGQQVILATGHSAGDVFDHLLDLGVSMEGKSFAVGLRIEHPQKWIDQIQFREYAGHPKLGAANYKLAAHREEEQIGVYSFCMCPGGYALSSGTEPDGIVVNGMSNYRRNSAFANSAIVVTVDFEKSFAGDLMGGIKWRRSLEHGAYLAVQKEGGGRALPVQRVTDFLSQKRGPAIPSSSPSGVVPVRLDELLPSNICESLAWGLESFEKAMKGFISPEAQFHGIESRTSCPLRITRDPQSLQSISHAGLYPTGEGAGYAGGITSAACDGIKVAEAIASL
jgi:uncharacterized FAD-dependent dehydrogenase